MPHQRTPAPDNDDWTQIKCGGCETGTILFDSDDCQRDGMICDGCEFPLCDACYEQEPVNDGPWGEKPHVAGLYCPTCLAQDPPHDKETCDTCAKAAAAAKLASERAAAEHAAKRAALDATVWPRMLRCARGVSQARADAIADVYPSAGRLFDAFAAARKRGITETALVADVLLPNGKRVGPAAAAAVCRALLKD